MVWPLKTISKECPYHSAHISDSSKKKKDLIKFMHTNAQSLLSNKDEVEILLKNNHVDVLCTSETWLLPCISDSLVNITILSIGRMMDAGEELVSMSETTL